MIRYTTLDQAIARYSAGDVILAQHDTKGRRFFVVGYDEMKSFCFQKDFLHEVQGEYGRILLDFDLPPCDIPIEDLVTHIRGLLINVFNTHIGTKYGNILMKEKIHTFDGSNEQVPPIAWAWRRDDSKTSIHMTLPFWSEDRKTCSRILYTLINDEARDHRMFTWLRGKNLVDMALSKKNASLRLPGMSKSTGGGILHTASSDVRHFISRLPGALIPDELKLEISADTLSLYSRMYELPSGMRVSTEIIPVPANILWQKLKITNANLSDIIGVEVHNPTCDTDMGVRLTTKDNYKCPVCNHMHDGKRKPVFMQWGKNIQLDCWRRIEGEYTGTPIVVDRLSGPSMKLKEVYTDYAKKYHSIDRSSTYRDQYGQWDYVPDIPDKGTVGIVAGMGKGKSTSIRRFIEKHKDLSILIIGSKVSHVDEMMRRFNGLGFTRYSRGDKKWTGAHRLIVQLESLHKCTRIQYDIVILDEVETTFGLFQGETIEKKEFSTSRTLYGYISGAIHVICADALETGKSYEFACNVRKMRSCVRMIDTSQPRKRPVTKYKYYDTMVSKAISDGRRKFMVFTSAKKAIDMAKVLASHDQRTLLIISDDMSMQVEKSVNLRVNDRNLNNWNQVQNVIISPTITCGVSYDESHFDTLYMYAGRGSCHPNDVIQMTHRVRHFRDDDVHIHISNHMDMRSIKDHCLTFRRFVDYMDTGVLFYDENDVQPALMSGWRNADKNIRYLIAHSHVRQQLGQLCFDDILLMYMRDIGWDITDDIARSEPIDVPIKSEGLIAMQQELISTEMNRYLNTEKWPVFEKKASEHGMMNKLKQTSKVMRVAIGQSKCTVDPMIIATQMYQTTWKKYDTLKKLLTYGGIDIHYMPVNCKILLKQELSNDKAFRDLLKDIGYSWGINSLDSRYLWSKIKDFLVTEVLCQDVVIKVVGKNNDREYIFKWIWNDIVIDDIILQRKKNRYKLSENGIVYPNYYEGVEDLVLPDGITIDMVGYR